MISFIRKTSGAGILIAALAAAFLLLAACEQPAGVVRDDDATLRALSVDWGALSPAFSASHFEYSVTVKNNIETITVNATPNSGKATVNGAGTKTLDVGSITIPVVVSTESGGSKTYTITVTRHDGSVRTIESADDMAKIGVEYEWSLVGDYRLANDIVLENWLPIGDKDAPFTGVFEGNEKKITLNSFSAVAVSEKTYLGIFGYVEGSSASADGTVSEKAEIKNLTIDSSVASSSTATAEQYIGLAAGRAEKAVFENIKLTGTFGYISARLIYLGGAVGEIGADTVVKNITSTMYMDIKPGISSTYHWVGGIVGRFIGGAGIENCHVTADIIADNVAATGSGQVFVGGITGGSQLDRATGFNTPAYYGYIQDSSFKGNLTGRAKGFWTYAGGIAGINCGGDVNSIGTTTRIERCFAEGTVSGTAIYPYVGGIIGYNYFGALVSQCYFNGSVIGENNTTTNDYIGGIVGYNSQFSTPYNARIEDCWSNGTVKGSSNAGGIVGRNMENALIRRSYSTAGVSVSSANGVQVAATPGAFSGIGGIAGQNAEIAGATENSLAHGNITACVALNSSITTVSGDYIHRVIGHAAGDIADNHARSGLTPTTGGTYTKAESADAADGASCADKPDQAFYVSLGWNFNNVWTMGFDGYPKLMWQNN